jgi:hypothetical protein
MASGVAEGLVAGVDKVWAVDEVDERGLEDAVEDVSATCSADFLS